MVSTIPDPSPPAGLPESNTDVTPKPRTRVDLDQPLGIVDGAVTVLRVATGHFTLHASVNTLRRADRLVVTFTGIRPGTRNPVIARRPFFERRRWDALFDAPILAISDPRTESEEGVGDMRVGLYFGTFEHDLVPEILALVNKVCDELGIGRDKVVMYGASTGGTAALLAGTRRREPTGIIAACPLLRPERFRVPVIERVVRAAEGSMELWDRTAREAPWRLNPLVSLRDGLDEGNDTRVVVLQNRRDRNTINRHFAALWRRFDVPPDGGVAANGRILTMLYASADEDPHEPRDLAPGMIAAAYEFFDRPIEPVAKGGKGRDRLVDDAEFLDDEED